MQGSDQGKPAALWLASAASAALLAGAHPPWSLWPLALVQFVPVGLVLLDPSRRRRPLHAAAAGLLFGAAATWMLVGPWAYAASLAFFGDSPLRAAAFTLALPILASAVALPYAAAFPLVERLAGLGATAGVAGGAAVLAVAEMARSSLGYGNPWGSTASALQAADQLLSGAIRSETPVAALLAIGGPPLVACAAAALSLGIALALLERRRPVPRARAMLAAAGAFAAIFVAGRLALPLLPERPAGDRPAAPLRIALVQSGIGGGRPWSATGGAEAYARQLELTRSPDTRGAELIVWPENALPFLLDANEDKKRELQALARERGAALLVGGSRSAPDASGRATVFNSAFLFPADGGEPSVYDKRILLPFVEQVPAWAASLLPSPWRGAYAAGTGEPVFDVRDWQVAPLVCLEALYPAEAAARAAEGADLLVNVSNDSWFDAGAGAAQHFSLATLLAAETRRPLVRVATTGISALVTDDGLVAWTLPQRMAGVALVDVPPPARDSLYVRGGRVAVETLLVLVALAAAILPAIVSRRVSGPPNVPRGAPEIGARHGFLLRRP